MYTWDFLLLREGLGVSAGQGTLHKGGHLALEPDQTLDRTQIEAELVLVRAKEGTWHSNRIKPGGHMIELR